MNYYSKGRKSSPDKKLKQHKKSLYYDLLKIIKNMANSVLSPVDNPVNLESYQ